MDERPVISAQNKGPILGILAGVCLPSCVTLAVLAILKRRGANGSFRLQSIEVSLMVILAPLVAQTIIVIEQVKSGLGTAIDTLSSKQLELYEKLGYAAVILFVLLILLSKVLSWLVVRSISPVKSTRSLATIIGTGISLAMFAFLIACAFQCQHPFYPLHTGKCFNRVPFWIIFGVTDVVTELTALGFLLHFVLNAQMQFAKKFKFSALACVRLGTISAAICRAYFVREAFETTDYTLNSWAFAMATQIELYMIVFVLSMSTILTLMESLSTGYLTSAYAARPKNKDTSYELKSSRKSFSEIRRGRKDSGASSVRPLTTNEALHRSNSSGDGMDALSAATMEKNDDQIVVTKQVDVAFEIRR